MSREAECRELINQLGELNKVKSLLLADIAVSLAQIADALGTKVTIKLDGDVVGYTLDGREVK